MKSLLILRHAEAAPASEQVPDLHRPLTPEGTVQARRQGERMRQLGIAFERVWCSAAARTRETAEALVAAGGFGVPLEPSERLYNAPGEVMLDMLRERPRADSRLLLVAHMPGVAELINLLVTEQNDLAIAFFSGTLAEIALDIERWEELEPGAGALRLLLPP
jgi:phosphohistidine phosphatase